MSLRRNAAFTISFVAIDSQYAPARKTGLTIANTDIWISKDGSNFVNSTNGATELTGITGRYKLVLTDAEMDCSHLHVVVVKTGMDDVDYTYATNGSPSGSVIASPSPSSTAFGTNRAEATNDYWKDTLIVFTSGALAGQVKKVSAYNGSTFVITVSSGFTSAPSTSDRFVLLNL